MRALLPILLVLLSAANASAQDVMTFVRGDRWAEADTAAAQYTDPVARKLVTFYRMLAPGQASAAEIAAFMAASPDWPFQPNLARRRDDALAAEPDDVAARAECDRQRPATADALLRCAAADAASGRTGDANTLARAAWVAGPADATWEAGFPAAWQNAITPADQWARFDRLAYIDGTAAQRQMARLAPADQPRAAARLALRKDDPQAQALLAALPADQRNDPGLVLEQLGWLRRAGQDAAAVALWKAAGTQAETASGAEHLGAFWRGRAALARQLLKDGDPAGAYALANDPAQPEGENQADSEFLAGFIALRQLHDPATAARHFQVLAKSTAAITQGRAHYWLGRAAEAAHDPATARAEYTKAAAWPNTFYGQLGALKLGDSPAALNARILALRDPSADAAQGLAFAGRELARAAAYLVAWGEQRRAEAFLLRLENIAPDPADRALAARLAQGFGLPDAAVAIARLAGRDGVVLLETGWPQPIAVPDGGPVEASLTLAITRQESSFDTETVSPAGARGLMQLMPATAATVARGLGLAASVPALVRDPGYNLRLGDTYLAQLLGQFGGGVALAVAGYNAGPNRVQSWIVTNGAPAGSGFGAAGPDIVDWIELIPFDETRNYVQRVVENLVVYRAKRGVVAPYPLPSLP